MKKNNIDYGLGIIKNTILDDLEKSLSKLGLDDDIHAMIIEVFENEKSKQLSKILGLLVENWKRMSIE